MIFDLIRTKPDEIQFGEVISYIDDHYIFSPTAFTNGEIENDEGQNNGSCKLLQFALLNNLTQQETLNCFGDYYRVDVLQNPDGTDHQNIRNFIKTGFEGLKFENITLKKKRK
jgi:hypothetical protein